MDRRRFDREPTNLDLYAHTGPDGHQRLRARDISSEGVFVEGWSTPPAQGALVSLTFVVNGGRMVKLLRREAVVSRVTEDGVGLVHGARVAAPARARGSRPSPWSTLRWPEVD